VSDGSGSEGGAAAAPARDVEASPRARLLAASDWPDTPYAGLATRALAFAIDAAIIDGVALLVGAVVALGLSLIGVPHDVRVVLAAIGAALAVGWSILYFAFFWSASGQTLGNLVMRIRVEDARTGEPVPVRRALVRLVGLVLAALPLCAGFLLILVNRRRRGLQDLLARTVVVYVRQEVRAGPVTVTRASRGSVPTTRT
jgi:uncharacterized RDD family membrane protein YckC